MTRVLSRGNPTLSFASLTLCPHPSTSRRVGCCYRLLRGAQTTALLYLGSRNIACCHVSLSPSCLIYVSRNQFRKGEGVDGGRSTQSSHRPILKAVKQHCAGGRGEFRRFHFGSIWVKMQTYSRNET
jgi:hypothetical protein